MGGPTHIEARSAPKGIGLVQVIGRDTSGNVYVADRSNNRIRKVTAAGVVSTLAGSGTAGFANGRGTAARFNRPTGVFVDSSGNVYVADYYNNRIRRITAAGVVTTLAGSGTRGHRDGIGTVARFNYPSDVAVDSAGDVYVADNLNHRIRKIEVAKAVTTLAGSGTADFANGRGASARFKYPTGVVVDSAGNIYVADNLNHRIRKITAAGVVTTLAGNGREGHRDGTGTATRFNYPTGVAVDSAGNIYVADNLNHRIREITAAGVVTTIAGNGRVGYRDGTGTVARFNYPSDVAVDSAGDVYVADNLNHRIRKIEVAKAVTTLAGSGTADFANGRGTAAQFNNPYGVAVDSAGNIYVADRENHRIRKITAAGVVSTLAGSGTGGFANGRGASARFKYPTGVVVDSAGNIYVADEYNHRIRKIEVAKVVTTLAGNGREGHRDGTGAAARFKDPAGVAVDSAGNVYVADYGNHRIRKITAAGVVSTLAGSGTGGHRDGTGTATWFYSPSGVAVDSAGNIYVADRRNNRIRKMEYRVP